MRISIDISAIVYGTGVSVYTRNLVENLLKIDKNNKYMLFGGSLRRSKEITSFINSQKELKKSKGENSELDSKVFPIPPTILDLIWNKLHILQIEALIGKTDVLHSSDWAEPPSRAFKVTTVHDLTPILHPEWSHPSVVSAHKARLVWVKKESDRVIAPSETTANDLNKLGYPEEKIRVIPEAADSGFRRRNAREISFVKNKYGIKGSYILAIGVNKRKNTGNIISAFDKLKNSVVDSLVIVGQAHDDFRATSGVIFTGHARESDMAALYSGALALVYPSLYEGFGLPILEAFACKTPVVTSDLGSMAETAGNAAVLVNPKSAESISEGVQKAINNCEKLAVLGGKTLAKYSWKKTAEKTIKVYNEAA